MTTALASSAASGSARVRPGLSTWTLWGRALLVPSVLVFLVFVLYPVLYGLWPVGPALARSGSRGAPPTGVVAAPASGWGC